MQLLKRPDGATTQYGAPGAQTIVEVKRTGMWLRVAAVDTETGLEATAIGPAQAGEDSLTRLALGKLTRLRRAVPA